MLSPAAFWTWLDPKELRLEMRWSAGSFPNLKAEPAGGADQENTAMQRLRQRDVISLADAANFLKPCPEDYKKRQGTVSYLEMLCKASNRCQLTGAIIIYFLGRHGQGVWRPLAKHSCLTPMKFDNINVHPCWSGKLSAPHHCAGLPPLWLEWAVREPYHPRPP